MLISSTLSGKVVYSDSARQSNQSVNLAVAFGFMQLSGIRQ